MCPPGRQEEVQGAQEGRQAGYCLHTGKHRLQAVIFYPYDWEDSSMDLLTAFSSLASQFRAAECVLYGCSSDSLAAHVSWTRSDCQPGFPLLSDPVGNLASRFGLFDPEELVAQAGVAILDSRGEVQEVVSSSLEACQLADYCLGVVRGVAGQVDKQAAFRSKAPNKRLESMEARSEVQAVDEPPSSPETKLPPGAPAIDKFWGRVVSREEETNQRSPSKLRVGFSQQENSGNVVVARQDNNRAEQRKPRSRPAWGPPPAPRCPVCDKPVYFTDQVFGADRKPFHKNCIGCQVSGCPNQLTAKSLRRSSSTMYGRKGMGICTMCHDREHPAEYAAPQKTAADLAEEEERKRLKEEAPAKVLMEMQKKMASCHYKGLAGPPEGPKCHERRLTGLEEYHMEGLAEFRAQELKNTFGL